MCIRFFKGLTLHALCAGLLRCALWALLAPAAAQASAFQVEVAYHLDASRELTPEQVQALPPEAWHRNGTATHSFGFTDAVAWFQVRVRPASGAAQDALLEITHPRLSSVQVFAIDAVTATPTDPVVMGAMLPFSQRPIKHRNFLVPLQVISDQPTLWLVRVETQTALQASLVVYTRAEFDDIEHWRVMGHGIYAGVLLAMLVYSLVSFSTSRDTIHLWFLGVALSYAVWVMDMAGLSFQWLWPQAPHWNVIGGLLAASLATLCGVQFVAHLLRFKDHWLTGWRVSRAQVGSILVSMVVCLFLPIKFGILLTTAAAMINLLVLICLAVWQARKQEEVARGLLKTGLVFVAGASAIVAARFGWLPSSLWLEYLPQISTVVDMSLFLNLLAARTEAERKQREQAQLDQLAQQMQWNAVLESKVEERTEELKRLNQSLAALSRTDALTGLFNRRYLEECIDALLNRCRRDRSLMAIFMLDIDHFKRVNDIHGHAAGDECLRTVAQRLLSGTRLGEDVLVRWGGEEFCLVALVWDIPMAASLGERLCSSISADAVNHGDTSIAITASIGIAVGTPQTRQEMLDIQQRADESLYAAKATGRNRCVLAPMPSGLGGL